MDLSNNNNSNLSNNNNNNGNDSYKMVLSLINWLLKLFLAATSN